jgi:cytochrome bd-type quinol oxidase subunit 1
MVQIGREWIRPGTHQVRDVARTPTVLRGIMPRARARATTRFDSMANSVVMLMAKYALMVLV